MEWLIHKEKNGKMFYTILYHSLNQEQVLENLTKFLEKTNKIMSDQYKRKLANDRLFSLKQMIEASWKNKDIINHLFFISDTKTDFYQLSNKQISILKNWNIPSQIIKKGKSFDIDYFVELFDDIHYYHVFHFNNNILKYYHLCSNKKKLVETHSMGSSNLEEDLINNCKITSKSKYTQSILHGTGTILKKIDIPNVVTYYKYYKDEELMDKFYTIRMEKIHQRFKETLGFINHPEKSKLLIFGNNEISIAINDYMIKTLFITPKKLKLLKQKVDPGCLNFEIIELSRIKKGDIFDIFVKDYSGLLGLLYYPNQ